MCLILDFIHNKDKKISAFYFIQLKFLSLRDIFVFYIRPKIKLLGLISGRISADMYIFFKFISLWLIWTIWLLYDQILIFEDAACIHMKYLRRFVSNFFAKNSADQWVWSRFLSWKFDWSEFCIRWCCTKQQCYRELERKIYYPYDGCTLLSYFCFNSNHRWTTRDVFFIITFCYFFHM